MVTAYRCLDSQAGNNTPAPYRFYLEEEIGAAVWVSTDHGESWSLAVGLRFLTDPSMSTWSWNVKTAVYGCLCTQYGIGESVVSTDMGKTWSAGRPSGIPHVCSRFSSGA